MWSGKLFKTEEDSEKHIKTDYVGKDRLSIEGYKTEIKEKVLGNHYFYFLAKSYIN